MIEHDYYTGAGALIFVELERTKKMVMRDIKICQLRTKEYIWALRHNNVIELTWKKAILLHIHILL